MSWLLNVSGEVPFGGNSPELEQRLVAELKAVLSRPEYGALSSWFRGVHVASAEVHKPAEFEVEPESALAEEPAPMVGRGRKAATATRAKE